MEVVREISASQIYGLWQPEEVTRFLARAANISGLDLERHFDLQALCHAESSPEGWGPPLDPEMHIGAAAELCR